MAVTIKDVLDFFKTGNPARDSLAAFKAKWMELTDDEREFFKSEVGKATGKS